MQGRRAVVAVVAIVAVLASVAGATAADALWSARVTATGTVTVGSVGVSIGPVSDETFTNATLSVTSPVTVTNGTPASSTVPGRIQVRLGSPSGNAIRANAVLVAWPVAPGGACDDAAAAPPDAVTGGWTPGITMPDVTVMPGATQQFCLRTSFADRQQMASNVANVSFQVSVDATLTADAFSAVAPTRTAQYSTSNVAIFGMTGNFWYRASPSNQATTCVGVSGGADAPAGSPVVASPCLAPATSAANANQWLAMSLISPNTVAVRLGGTATDRVLQVNGDGTLTSATRDASNPDQGWQPQIVGTNTTYQLVADRSGLCLTASATDATLSLSACVPNPLQRFVFTQLAVAPPPPL